MSSVEEKKQPDEGELWDAPNQQVVREDQSPPWEEGTGGKPGTAREPEPEVVAAAGLDEMTKAQLLEYAQSKGYSPANAAMSKDEIRATIDQNETGG